MIKVKELNKSSKFSTLIVNRTFLSKGCFKTENQGITTLFQGEVKYLNLINHNFSKVFDLIQVRFARDCLISGFSIGVTFSRLHTIKSISRIPVLDFTF